MCDTWVERHLLPIGKEIRDFVSGVAKALMLATAWVVATVVSSIIAEWLLNQNDVGWLQFLLSITFPSLIQTAIGVGLFIFLPVASVIDFNFHLIVSEHGRQQFVSRLANCVISFFIIVITVSLYLGRSEAGHIDFKGVLVVALLCLVTVQKAQTYLKLPISEGREL
jgi:hypothetical protein